MILSQQQPSPFQTQKTLSLIELIQNGGLGGQIIIGFLCILLLTVVYIYFERIFAIRSAVKITPTFMSQIRSFVIQGKVEDAQKLCSKENIPVSRLVSKGLSRIGRPLEDINTAIENAGRLEVYQLEKNISILATIAGAAPMLGFLGTVIGMIDSFNELDRLDQLCADSGVSAKILLRVTPGVEAHTHEFVSTGQEDSKFGFTVKSGLAAEAVERVRRSTHLELFGLHAHIGSQVFDVEPFAKAVGVLAEFAAPFDFEHSDLIVILKSFFSSSTSEIFILETNFIKS